MGCQELLELLELLEDRVCLEDQEIQDCQERMDVRVKNIQKMI